MIDDIYADTVLTDEECEALERQRRLAARYQFQPWHIKAYRWLRWKPVYACLAAWAVVRWVFSGCPREDLGDGWLLTRRETLGHIWTLRMSLACNKTQHYYTMEEVFADMDWGNET